MSRMFGTFKVKFLDDSGRKLANFTDSDTKKLKIKVMDFFKKLI